ncbi:anti-sigma factor domain-containing protein [Isoptericola sp. NPDC019571]|uniref:anti-sigma factor n=1 Tax=Isoptericola sp. NPDC019571 TaxID=3364008 RepID=UPI0037917082
MADTDANRDAWDLLPAYALDAVDDLERRAVERLLESDADARRALDEYRDVVAAFAVEQAPPAHVRDAVLTRVAQTPQRPAAPSARPAEGPAGRRWVRYAVAAAAVVAVAVPTTIAVQEHRAGLQVEAQLDRVAEMLADPDAQLLTSPVAGGGAASVLAAGDDFLFTASDLPGPGEGKDYQLWVVGSEGDVAPAGVLQASGGRVEHLVQDVPGVGVAVTVEPDGGSEQPTTDPIVVLAEG